MSRHGSRRRLYILLSIALITCVGVLAYREFRLSRPVGEGPAGPAVTGDAFKTKWSDRRVHLIGIGDSITAGLGANSPSHTFFNRIVVNPRDEYPDMQGVCLSSVLPNLTYENLAISGSESSLHSDVINDIATHDEDVFGIVMMTSGGNDLIHMYGRSPPRECAMYGATVAQASPWIANFEKRLGVMLDRLTASFPGGCEIYLGDIYDPTDGVGDAPSIFLPHWPDGLAIHARYNAAIRLAASQRNHVFVVPLHQTFLGHGSHCRQPWNQHYCQADPHYWFHTNIEDPNDRGYDAIRRVFMNTILENTAIRESAVPILSRQRKF